MADAITPLTAAQTAAAEQSAARDGYILRVLVQADMLANVIIGGKPDETISTDTALLDRKHVFMGRVVSHILDLFQADHGAQAAAGDLERAQEEEARLKACGLTGQ